MGYALFAQRKLVLDSQLNSTQLQQTQRSNEQFALATRTSGLNQQLTSLAASQSQQLSALFSDLASATSEQRPSIQAAIDAMEALFEVETDKINRKIYQVEIKENAIEMEVKRLDTQVTALQKQLDAVEQAESDAIDRATPKFKGVG